MAQKPFSATPLQNEGASFKPAPLITFSVVPKKNKPVPIALKVFRITGKVWPPEMNHLSPRVLEENGCIPANLEARSSSPHQITCMHITAGTA